MYNVRRVTVFADAKAGDSATGKTELADTGFDTDYEPKADSYEVYCTYKTYIAGMTRLNAALTQR